MQGTFVHKESQVRVLKSEQRIKVVRTLLAAHDIALHKEEDKKLLFLLTSSSQR